MAHKDSIFSLIKMNYHILKVCGFFCLTINFTEPEKFVFKTTWKDYVFLLISFFAHFNTARLELSNKDFEYFSDSRIIEAGLKLSRLNSLVNSCLIVVFRFINRKRIAQILKNIYLMDQRVSLNY